MPHKLPSRQESVSVAEDSGEVNSEENSVHTNLYGVNFIIWFDIGIEGKDSMDQEEEEWGGRVEFGFKDSSFPKEIEEYFLVA